MKEEILHVIHYFATFAFPPSLDEIHSFLPSKFPKAQLKVDLIYLTQKGVLVSKQIYIQNKKITCYATSAHKYFFEVRVQREIISLKKLAKLNLYLKLLQYIPWIKFVGISGSTSMLNASEEDDIDLFVITAANRLWLARFFALLLASLFRLRGKNNLDKICLNILFDERDLAIPHNKKNEYVGHEVIQMKPVVDKNETYDKFISQNSWVYDFFPNLPNQQNAKKVRRSKKLLSKQSFIEKIGNIIELILKKIQLHKLQKQELQLITYTQLWLIQDDFQRKIPVRLKTL